MKFEECKIGDFVKTNSNEIKIITSMGLKTYTPERTHFKIVALNYDTRTVNVQTRTSDAFSGVLHEIDFVYPSCLDVDKFSMSDALHGQPITRPQTSDYKLDFEVRREANELSAYYHGVKLATVRCHPDDVYDEEFGLHLLLRRACLKLKDEHTVVETVEELLQKP